jgi:hypothetical protein
MHKMLILINFNRQKAGAGFAHSHQTLPALATCRFNELVLFAVVQEIFFRAIHFLIQRHLAK